MECNDTGRYSTLPFDEKGIRNYVCDAYVICGSSVVCYTTNKLCVAYTGLPTLYLGTNDAQSSITKEKYVSLTNFKLVDTAGGITDSSKTKGEKIKGRGNTSWDFPKKGYNIKFEKKTAVLGMSQAKKWSIVSNYLDKSQMRNVLASYLGNEIFIETDNPEWKPNYRYVDVIWNGQYQGIYTIVESIQINGNRIDVEDISELFESSPLDNYSGNGSDLNALISSGYFDVSKAGFVLEVDTRKDATYVFTSALGLPMCLKDPDFDDYTNTQAQLAVTFMRNKINAFESFLTSKYSTATLEEWSQYIDVDSFVNWFLVEDFTKSVDANFWTSVYLYYNPNDGLIHMGPDWDFDRCIGSESRDGNTSGYYIDTHQGSWPSWYEYLIKSPAFKNAVKTKWNENKDDLYDKINAFMESKKAEISTAIILDSKKWNRLGQDANSILQNLTTEMNSMLTWMQARINWYNNEFK
ncbi:MAG: CotH kinase family protein [Bacillota bacterium]|nr:CotH kinase family protein [Bacillota bacterium]